MSPKSLNDVDHLEALESVPDGVRIRVRVQPKASRNSVQIEDDGRIRVALTAPPVDGAANKALIRYMALFLGVKRRDLVLLGGERSRDKTLLLSDGDLGSVRQRFALLD